MRVQRLVAALSIGLVFGVFSGCGQAEPDPGRPTAVPTSDGPDVGSPDEGEPTPSAADGGAPGSADTVPDEVRLRARPQSRVVQEWAAAYAEIVNAGDETQSAAAKVMTRDGLDRMSFYTRQDWGRYFPGPLPITVIKISKPSSDGVTWVHACAWMRGWSQASQTDRQREEREIAPVKLGLKRKGGAWLVDGMSNGKDGACAGVRVEGTSEGRAG